MRIFLGGYPGAGKSYFSRHLEDRGWTRINVDEARPERIKKILATPVGELPAGPLVMEGGFLADAPRFQEMIQRHNLRTFWLTGTKEQLIESRLQRKASWDNPRNIRSSDWIGLVDKYRNQVNWDRTIRMWRDDGTRKTLEEIYLELFTSF